MEHEPEVAESNMNGSSSKPKTDKNKPEDSNNDAYPYYTLDELAPRNRIVMGHYGAGVVISRKDICVLLGKAEPTLKTYFSTNIQVGYFENHPGRGVSITPLFEQSESGSDDERLRAKIIAMNNSPLYKRLIENFNNKTLGKESGLAEQLAKEYGVNQNSSMRAAMIFFKTGRSLGVIDSTNRLKYLVPPPSGKPLGTPPPADPAMSSVGGVSTGGVVAYFEAPYDLDGDLTATLKYPKNKMTIENINMLDIQIQSTLNSLRARIGHPMKPISLPPQTKNPEENPQG